jgi:hypothetical protein
VGSGGTQNNSSCGDGSASTAVSISANVLMGGSLAQSVISGKRQTPHSWNESLVIGGLGARLREEFQDYDYDYD